MPKNKVLLVEDDRGIRFGIRNFLAGRDFDVDEAETLKQGEESYKQNRPDIVILDYSLPDGNALEVLPRLKAADSSIPIVILTGHGSIDLAVRAIKEGAEQFLTKPVQMQALLVVIERLLDNQRVRHREQARSTQQARTGTVDPFIGVSAQINEFREHVERIVSTDRPILIFGETGTGKSVLATWLHRNGPRAEEAFVDLNCAGLARDFVETELFGHEKGAFTGAVAAKTGLLEVAHRGVLFLDEIGDVDIQVQPKLLKVLEEKRFRRMGEVRDRVTDVQLIAATHQDLHALIREKRFRSDLYFRISTIPLTIPSLRERREDIPLLADFFVSRFGSEMSSPNIEIAPAAMKMLQDYGWPGNVRELKNVIERAILLSDRHTITPHDVRFDSEETSAGAALPADMTLEQVEKWYVERVLREENGRVDSAAKRLGIPRSTLYQKLKKWELAVSRS
ncbi:MAG TPA: sigma-54 dependent transcriptional regulator [Thermoanaerobaculia bacterium]|nr:sigma-54 dependent transcriptional regulator [Thermoanaerobaculia bacterium]